MLLHVKLNVQELNKVTGELGTQNFALPQIFAVQVGGGATAITWNECQGEGTIRDFKPGSSVLLPVTLMAETDGIINKQSLSSQYIDCFRTVHVENTHLCTGTIRHSFDHGKMRINLMLSPFADFASSGPVPQYSSKLVQSAEQGITQGDYDIKLCLAMITSGLDKALATAILQKQNVNVSPDVINKLQNLKYTLLQSQSEGSLGIKSMHHTVISRTLHQVRARLPLNLKSGFFHLLQAWKYCQDANIEVRAENSTGMQQALEAVIQYSSCQHQYKYDKTLNTEGVQFGDNFLLTTNAECDIQRATVDKMRSHAIYDQAQFDRSVNAKCNLSQSLGNLDYRGDCEDFAYMLKQNADAMAAPHKLVSKNRLSLCECQSIVADLLLQQHYECSASELSCITEKCMLLSQTWYHQKKIHPCIGLAGAANLQESKSSDCCVDTQQSITKLFPFCSGHAWTLGIDKKSFSATMKYTHKPSNCLLSLQFLSLQDPMTCFEGTGVAFTDPKMSPDEKVQFKLDSKLKHSPSNSVFETTICKLNNKIMPEFMAVSLASTIHQTVLANAYQFSAKSVATQPPMSGFYKAMIAFNKNILFQTTRQNVMEFQSNPNEESLVKFMQNATVGYIPNTNAVTVLLQVQPLNPAFHLGINRIAASLATRILDPEEQEAHYAKCMRQINQRHGVNMPLSRYAIDLMNPASRFPPTSTSLKFIANTDRQTIEKMVQDKTIKTYISLSPSAHLCCI